MTALYAEFTVKSGHEVSVSGLMRDLTRAVRAEPGNLTFDPHVLDVNPRHYVVFEVYRDRDAFESHVGSEHSRLFNEALADRIEEPSSQLTWLRQVPWAKE